MIHNRMINMLSIITIVLSFSSCQVNKNQTHPESKYNPGHYVAVSPFFDLSEITYLGDTSLQGINKRYFWRTLEPQKDAYDLSFIEEDLEFCSKHDKQLVVFSL